MESGSTRRLSRWALVPAALGVVLGVGVIATTAPAATASRASAPAAPGRPYAMRPGAVGGLDCNGYSPAQKTVLVPNACTDIRGDIRIDNRWTWGGRFYDNGHYIGHDEPDMGFISSQPGSGNNVNWSETLPVDPSAAPTVATPGRDVMHTVELTVAPWFGMDLCDGSSYPQLPCTPNSDSNAPACAGIGCSPQAYPGGGSAFLEMQFYPPGEGPFPDNISCDNTHWCASLHINELMCTLNFQSCNNTCGETTNFGFVQRNGVPTGPPSPQLMNLATSTPNAETLLMNPGDKLKIHIWDAPAPGVPNAGIPPGKALEVSIDDLTTGQSGFMQASAFNGFAQTDILTCNGRLFNFEPEYSTSKPQNIVPWAAISANISTEFEIGHFEPCTAVSNPVFDGAGGATDPIYNSCTGPYEAVGSDGSSSNPESAGEAVCYPKGDTHGTLNSDPNIVGACEDNIFLNGDLDYNGSPYYNSDWPSSTSINRATSRVPSSFVQSLPTTLGRGYPRFFFQTDAALSEVACTPKNMAGCTVPPRGSFVETASHVAGYPFWSERDTGGTCTINFGDVTSGAGVRDFGGSAQYGTAQFFTLGYPEFESRIYSNSCPANLSQGYYLVGKGGQVVVGGDAPALSPVHSPSAAVVSIAATPSGKGYYAVTDTGSVSTAGDAAFKGDLITRHVKASYIVAVVPKPDMGGYWLLGADGSIFPFGDAKSHGSLPGVGVHVNDIVGMVASASGNGYLLVARDGGVFAFGDAKYRGSLPARGVHVNDIVGVVTSPTGNGYVLIGADGGAFSFGTGAPFHGSLPGKGIHVSDIVGIALTTDGGGYWMAGSNGTVYPFGNARALPNNFAGSDTPISAITGVRTDVVDIGP